MHSSRLGITFALVYLLPSMTCVAMALSSGIDSKGSFVLLQLPITLQLAALSALGMADSLRDLSWDGGYLFLGLPVLLALYGFGRWLERLVGRRIEQ